MTERNDICNSQRFCLGGCTLDLSAKISVPRGPVAETGDPDYGHQTIKQAWAFHY